MAGEAFKTSAQDLKKLVEKTGQSLKSFHAAEKLDLLNAMTNQIKDKITSGTRLLLTLTELNAFLRREGCSPGADAKSAVTSLVELRQRQLKRLGGYVGPVAGTKRSLDQEDKEFLHEFSMIPVGKVRDIFSEDSATAKEEDKMRLAAEAEKQASANTGKRKLEGLISDLAPELRALISDTQSEVSALELDWSVWEVAHDEEDSLMCAEQASKEVERILQQINPAGILGGGSAEDQIKEFQRLARLLHPDKGYVAADDKSADTALRLVFVARKKLRKDSV